MHELFDDEFNLKPQLPLSLVLGELKNALGMGKTLKKMISRFFLYVA